MNRVLLRLRYMLFVAKIRGAIRKAKTPKGILFGLIGMGIMLMGILPNLFLRKVQTAPDPQNIRVFSPLVLLMLCLPMLFNSKAKLGIIFKPAEIDFLFPAPLTRRALIGHKLMEAFFGTLILTGFFTLLSLQHMPSWICGWMGMYLGFVFIHLLGMVIPLFAMTVSERVYTRGRKVMIALISLLVVAGLIPLMQTGFEDGAFANFATFRKSLFGQILFAPFEPFGRLMGSTFHSNDVWFWLGCSIGLNALAAFLIVRLDANFLEASAASSQRLYEKIQRMKTGGAQAVGEISGERTKLLPMPPSFGGAGPLFWQQMTTAVRQRFGLKLLFLIVISAGLVSYITRSSRTEDDSKVSAAFYPIIAMMVFTIPSMITFDFRAHIERLDWLKTLPVTGARMFMAQIATPVIIACTLQAILVLCAVAFFNVPAYIAGIVLLFLIPANIIMIGFENIFFLLFPIRLATGMDFQATGRNMLVMSLKFTLLLVVFGLVAAVGGLAWLIFGDSYYALIAGSWIGAMVAAIGIIPAGAVAWNRLDPAADLPA